ncbi:hypothetical protein ABZV31_01020 [Streptomyces sp. NPDC005202]|uniref:hypothetical protein n=1 Tax=Streptomyces sp. NPDC005202 TaxID=3157021 RepID=UPI0033A5D8A3
MRALDAEFEGLRDRLEAMGRPVVAWMLPGVDADHVASVLGAAVPDSVAQWFRWCNGVAVVPGQIQDQVNVIPGYSPLSLEEGLRMRDAYTGDDVLGDHWVPLLGSGGGDLYAAVWAPGEEAVVAGVLVGEPTETEFSSIEQMVTTFNVCYDRGAFFVDDQGRLAMSPDLYDGVYDQVVGQ